MPTISEEIIRLNNAKQDLAAAIEEKGVSVDGNASIEQYGAYVRSIPQEGGSGEPLVYLTDEEIDAICSYTIKDYLESIASEEVAF